MVATPQINGLIDNEIHLFIDNGGRRTGIERRQYTYSGYIPERRVRNDRRNGIDRRAGQTAEVTFEETKSGQERRACHSEKQDPANFSTDFELKT